MPALHAEPAGHLVQLLASVRFNVLEYVPAKQGSSAEAPAGQKRPSVHCLHAVAPFSFW